MRKKGGKWVPGREERRGGEGRGGEEREGEKGESWKKGRGEKIEERRCSREPETWYSPAPTSRRPC